MGRTRRWKRRAGVLVAAVAIVATAAACSSSGGSSNNPTSGSSGGSSKGGGHNSAPGAASNTITVAQQPNATINYIFPIPDFAHLSPDNLPWDQMMYRGAYVFGKDGKPVLNEAKSLAYPPTWSADRKTVTIKLKPWKWSNGEPITAQNLMFAYNIRTQNLDKLPGVPGYYPLNVASAEVTAPDTFVMHLKRAFNTQWYLYAQMGGLTPMPEAWDVTGAGQKANCSTKPSDCKAVYTYLAKESNDTKTYDTNPLWKVVSGPWMIQKFKVQGDITMVPNKNYSGPDKPKVAKYVMKAFTSSDAEYNVLQNGNILDVGYIPSNALKDPKPAGSGIYDAGPSPVGKNYDTVVGTGLYGPTFLQFNYNDPKMSAVFKQLYFRQALASTVDQQSIIKNLYKGYGFPTYGPVPLYPKSDWLPSVESEASYPYKYDIDKAKKFLSDNGWKVNPGGASVCENPGTGPGQCGAGIPKGKKLSFEFIYFSGDVTGQTLVSSIKSEASKAGIDIVLHPMPGQLVQGTVHKCKPSECKWQASSGAWGYVYYPSGEQIYRTGAFGNFGSFSDPKVDALIDQVRYSSDNNAIKNYASEVAKLLPGIWMPSTESVTAYAKGLKGYLPAAHDPYSTPFASELYFEK